MPKLERFLLLVRNLILSACEALSGLGAGRHQLDWKQGLPVTRKVPVPSDHEFLDHEFLVR